MIEFQLQLYQKLSENFVATVRNVRGMKKHTEQKLKLGKGQSRLTEIILDSPDSESYDLVSLVYR
jgi:hypothetical protein